MKQNITLNILALFAAIVFTQSITRNSQATEFRTTTTISNIKILPIVGLPFDADTVLTLTQDYSDSGAYMGDTSGNAILPALAANLNISNSPNDDGNYSPSTPLAHVFAAGGSGIEFVGRTAANGNAAGLFSIPSGTMDIKLNIMEQPFVLNPQVGDSISQGDINTVPDDFVTFRRIGLSPNQFAFNFDVTHSVGPVPEPTTGLLLLFGALVLVNQRRRTV